MNEKPYGRILMENFVAAIPWAVVFSVALLGTTCIVVNYLRQEAKEAIEYTANYGVRNAIRATMDDPVVNGKIVPKVKEAVKKTIEFAVITDRAHPHAVLGSGPGARR